ncbi:phosphoinositide phospholipase C 2-like [Fagus crenata]
MTTKQHFKVCFCFKRIFKLRVPEPPEDIKYLFGKYSENGTMTIDNIQQFLIEVQGEHNASKDSAQAIINSHKHLNLFPRKGLSLVAFFRYLISDNNANPLHRPEQYDMEAPLAHYFLYTGHNSYLTGNQISSDSSVNPIIDALKKGVRVIELDLWPNSNKDDVEVRHGGTLTRPVELIKCLLAIKEHAFEKSEYPVVITFEDHLGPKLQAKVAQMVTKTFRDSLYRHESEYIEEFPSPESLKRKILISTKPPKEYLDDQSSMEREGSQSQEDSEEEKTYQGTGQRELEPNDEVEIHNQEEDEASVAPEYRKIIAIHAGKPKGGLEDCLDLTNKTVRRLSLSEQELESATKTHGTAIVRFTQRNLLRVYPKGMRFDSSNYNPMLGWMHGAQMVAFNMQGYGKFLWIMQGMFRANGGCGYVKKPDFLLRTDRVFDPSVVPLIKKKLKVSVLMGEGWLHDFDRKYFDRFSPPDFFVKVGIAGFPEDEIKHETKAIEDEWRPVWNEEFEFPLRVPELAVLRIEALEYDTAGPADFAGQTCLPVSELRSGIRAVPLYNKMGDKYAHVKLLMGFEFIRLSMY